MTGLKDRADRPMYESSEDAMYSARTDACARFGGHTRVDLIPLPRFYYDGIELECDLFCGAPVTHAEQESSATHRFDLCMTARDAWLSIASDATALADTLSALRVFLARFDLDSSNALAEHWMASTEDLPAAISMPGLVDGTRVSVTRMAEQLSEMDLQFANVVKQTAHYVGASADELHANMRVRKACYA